MYSSASAIVLCIFQLPAISGVRLLSAQRLHARAASCPSTSSSDAPPPVERWSTWSCEPELRERRGASRRRRRPWCPAPRRPPRRPPRVPGGERLELERAHRAVPEDRARAPRSPRRSARPRPRADVEAHPAVGHVDAVELPALGVGGERARRARGRPAARSLRGRRASDALGARLDALLLAQRVADVVALRPEEREAHRAADQHRVGDARGSARSRRSCRSPSRRRRPPRAGAPGRSRIAVQRRRPRARAAARRRSAAGARRPRWRRARGARRRRRR